MRIVTTLAAPALVLGLSAAGPAVAQTLEDLRADAETPGDILTYGMGYGQQRHSPLDQIDRESVARLTPAWTYSLADDRGQETHPILHDGTMYVTTHDATMALDPLTGRQKWKTTIEYPAETPRVACCGIVNRGVAIYDGKRLPHHARRPRPGPRRRDGRGDLEDAVDRVQRRLLDDGGAADRRRGADRRHLGRRVRHPRLHRGLRPRDR